MTEIEVDLGYVARSQFTDFHRRRQRWACILAHRRAGKTVACVMDLVAAALDCPSKDGRFGYISPTYTQSKDVAWHYLKRFTANIPDIEQRESDLSVKFHHNGARIRLYGADNYDRMRGLYFDGVVLDEYADMDPRAWPEVIRPALADRQGWATFIGTPKGRNAFYDLWQTASKNPDDWFTATLRADETGLLPEEELANLRTLLTTEQYAQEMLCSFDAAIVGAYYGREMTQAEADKRIGRVPHDRAADVFASWDLGIGDTTAIWIGQIVGREWHWINYYENSGHALDHYVDWIKALPYKVHQHYLPHDGEARELQTGKSRRQFLEERELKVKVVPRHEPMDGIDAARLRFNRFWFDADKCARGIDCLRMYRSEFDDKNQVLRPRPLHDWASHGADAFRCGVMGAEESKPEMPKNTRAAALARSIA
jgi:phage terminase large subunit